VVWLVCAVVVGLSVGRLAFFTPTVLPMITDTPNTTPSTVRRLRAGRFVGIVTGCGALAPSVTRGMSVAMTH
jgi:hypothetical protein